MSRLSLFCGPLYIQPLSGKPSLHIDDNQLLERHCLFLN